MNKKRLDRNHNTRWILAALWITLTGVLILTLSPPAIATEMPDNMRTAEQIIIPSDGTLVQSSLILQTGIVYTVEITGVYRYDVGESGEFADAQYREDDNDHWTIRYNSVEFDGQRLSATESDLPGHTYRFLITGHGQALRLQIYDDPWAYYDNAGFLTAKLQAHGYTISGRVGNEQGEPLENVTVADHAGHSAPTESNGVYTFSGLPSGVYTLTATKPGYSFAPPERVITLPPDADTVNFTGVPAPASKHVVVLVHGWQMDLSGQTCRPMTHYDYDQNFPALARWLDEGGFDVWSAHLDSNLSATPSLAQNAACLSQHLRDEAIQDAIGTDPDRKVILIAHSMGGLVSRAYIESDLYQDDVATLITLGSPHQGISLSVLVRLLMLKHPNLSVALELAELACSTTPDTLNPQAGVCEIAAGMDGFNRMHLRHAEVNYYVLSGALSFWDATWLGRTTQLLVAGADDGLVPLTSGLGLEGALTQATTGEGHHRDLASYDYFRPAAGLSQSDAFTYCIRPVLAGEPGGCSSAPMLRAADAGEPAINVAAPIASGLLLTGQTFTQSIGLEQGPALITGSWRDGTLAFYLTTPSGQVIDPSYAITHPDQVNYLAAPAGEIPAGGSYLLNNAMAGTWTVHLVANSMTGSGAPFTLLATMSSNVALEVMLDRSWYLPGQTSQITATLTGQASAVAVNARIQRPDGAEDTVVLNAIGDNRFSGAYVIPQAPGYAMMQVTAQAENAGTPVAREELIAFQIASQVATLDGLYGDRPVDTNSDGRYEQLAVDVAVQVRAAASVGLSAQLISPSDRRVVASAATLAQVVPGSQTITLLFDGNTLRTAGIDGPYLVTSLLLTDQRDATLPMQELNDAWTTAFYDHEMFGVQGSIFLPWVVR